MKTWINFLHIYQPPTQTAEIVEKVTHESYEKIILLLETYPNWKVTINISGSLVELLVKNKREDILEKLKKCVENKQVELVGSAMYHPILALLPDEEIKEQIALNTEILKKYFGDMYNPKGFFIPEMAYSKKVADIVSSLGFSYLILDSIHIPKNTHYNPDRKYKITGTHLDVIFRDRIISKTFPPEYIETNKNKMPEVIITAHDGELYGHWHKDDAGFYKKVFTDQEIETKTISEYLQNLENKNHEEKGIHEITPRDASWESLETELEAGISYALWNDPKNVIHRELWDFAYDVLHALKKHTEDENSIEAVLCAHQGLASCAWWWASERKLGPFSPVTWNPTEIEKGLNMLLNAIRSLHGIIPQERVVFEERSASMREMIWKKHWTEISRVSKNISAT